MTGFKMTGKKFTNYTEDKKKHDNEDELNFDDDYDFEEDEDCLLVKDLDDEYAESYMLTQDSIYGFKQFKSDDDY